MLTRLYHPLILRGACKNSCTCRAISAERLTLLGPLHINLQSRMSSQVPTNTVSVTTTSSSSSPVVEESGRKSESNSLSRNQHNRLKCLFCRIVDGNEPKAKDNILYQDEEFVVFPDIRPAAVHHLLVVTREHIKDAKSLTSSQIELLDRMVETGKKVLSDRINSEQDPSKSLAASEGNEIISKAVYGFHWPPFHTVSHLHLHVIAPSHEIGFIGRIIFRPNSYWFVPPGWVKERLMKLKSEIQSKSTSS